MQSVRVRDDVVSAPKASAETGRAVAGLFFADKTAGAKAETGSATRGRSRDRPAGPRVGGRDGLARLDHQQIVQREVILQFLEPPCREGYVRRRGSNTS